MRTSPYVLRTVVWGPSGLLGPGIDLRVAVGGAEISAAEPSSVHVRLDTGLRQVDGGGVPEHVRRDPAFGADVNEARGVPAHDLVDARSPQGPAARGEHRSPGRDRRLEGIELRSERSAVCLPQGAGPPFVAPAVETDQGTLAGIEVPRL